MQAFPDNMHSEKNFIGVPILYSFRYIYFCLPVVTRIIVSVLLTDMVVVAQLVRALDCGSRGRGFESRLPPF